MLSVPFSVPDNHSGASRMQGMVWVEDDELVIEMKVKLFNLFKRPAQGFRFDLTDLEEVRHVRRVWGDTLTIRTRPLDRAAQIPGSHDGQLCLKVRRRDRAHLDALLDRLDLWVAE